MNENLLKMLFKTKLQIIDNAEKLLPEAAKKNIDKLKLSFIKAVNEVSKEYIEKNSEKEPNKDITNISID